MNKRLIQIDHDTGEVVDESFVAYVVPKHKNGFQQGWLAMAQNGAEILAQSDLGANDFKVLMKLLSVLDYENLIQSQPRLILQGSWICIDNTCSAVLSGLFSWV